MRMRKRPAAAQRQRGASTLLMAGLALVLVLFAAGAAVATLYFTGMIGGAPVEGELTGEEGDLAGDEGEEHAPPDAPPLYLPLEPALVVNFERRGRVGYLQVSIEVMAREQAVIDAVQTHMPVVRNNLISLMSGKSYKEIETREQKDALREQARLEVNQALERRGVEGQIEALYFTAFVMQ